VAGRFEGKVALITGAAGGIGSAAAWRLAGEGARLLLSDADGDRARALAAELGEGVFLAAPLTDTSLADFRRVIDVNVTGVFLGMRTVAPAMIERRAGSVINVSSVAGLVGPPMLTAYAASKWAVRGMSKVAAKELAQFGVRVNSLHPVIDGGVTA
jgi:3alpha(or 20beta)-hydroxysteroid dehydrogenase